MSLVQQVIKAVDNDLAFLPIAEMDFGQEFKKEIERSQIYAENKSQIQQRCFNFLKRLLREMAQRLPANFEILKKIELLSPRHCTSQVRIKFESSSRIFPYQIFSILIVMSLCTKVSEKNSVSSIGMPIIKEMF